MNIETAKEIIRQSDVRNILPSMDWFASISPECQKEIKEWLHEEDSEIFPESKIIEVAHIRKLAYGDQAGNPWVGIVRDFEEDARERGVSTKRAAGDFPPVEGTCVNAVIWDAMARLDDTALIEISAAIQKVKAIKELGGPGFYRTAIYAEFAFDDLSDEHGREPTKKEVIECVRDSYEECGLQMPGTNWSRIWKRIGKEPKDGKRGRKPKKVTGSKTV